jgi:hypothetical protein
MLQIPNKIKRRGLQIVESKAKFSLFSNVIFCKIRKKKGIIKNKKKKGKTKERRRK